MNPGGDTEAPFDERVPAPMAMHVQRAPAVAAPECPHEPPGQGRTSRTWTGSGMTQDEGPMSRPWPAARYPTHGRRPPRLANGSHDPC
jgi:hypothetical protein